MYVKYYHKLSRYLKYFYEYGYINVKHFDCLKGCNSLNSSLKMSCFELCQNIVKLKVFD